MFVNNLSHEEKVSLVQLFTYIARADGEIAPQEWDFLNQFAQEHGLTYDIHEVLPIEIICANLTSLSVKVIALQQMIKMAMTDGNYDGAERAQIIEVAAKMSVSLQKFKEIESWAIEGQEWVKRGEQLVNA